MNIKAKRLVLSLVSASRGMTVSAAEVIAASALFGVADTNARVILLRLVGDGVLEQPARGVYRLSAKARKVADEVGLWRTKETHVRGWHGDYAVVMTDGARKLDLFSKRQRAQGLLLMGFKELRRGVYVRPNNLESDLVCLRLRLASLGVEDSALVFSAKDFDETTIAHVHGLWDGEALNRGYHDLTEKLQRWIDTAQTDDANATLRESYLRGAEAIRAIAFDPMLPATMVDVGARQRLISTACQFDDMAHALWLRFLYLRGRSADSENPLPLSDLPTVAREVISERGAHSEDVSAFLKRESPRLL